MHLSRLTAVGFKSFAQRLDLPFQKGISCVVGPNGCGKSNVVDALRWALGEQRTRSLRSHHMEDVIFAGSRTRKPLGMAEVSVTIDNSTNLLPTDYTEITVTRRLFRSGESDYLLNKVPCRLKDIQNLFMDTGLGASHAYVIEQGMVDEIISDNPEERRRLFEEAAGVTRYKVRRKSAWNKLISIQLDLEQIALLIGEVERQVGSLRRQERRARLYKQLTGELEELDIQLARYRYFEMAARSEPMLEEIAFLKEDVEVGAVDITRLEAQIEETRAELAQQDQAVSDASAAVSRHVEVVHRKDREILVAREEAKSIESFLARAGQQQEELGSRRESARQQEEAAAQGSSQAAESLAEAEGHLESQTEALESLMEALESSREEAENRKARLISVLGEIREMNGSLERSRAELNGLSQRRSRLADDVERVRARRAEADSAAADAAGRIDEAEQKAADRSAQRTERVAARTRLQEERDRLAESHSALSARAETYAARLTLLKRLREGFEGYSQGIRAVAVDSPFSDRVRGVVADLIDLDSEHTAAIEAALGRALECLLVDSTTDAAEAMAYLRSEGQGAAAFLPLDRVSHATGIPWDVPSGDGVIGRASDLLRNVRNGSEAIAALLRRVLVVTDLDAAAPLMSRMRSQRVDIVTLSGELLSADGTIYGGAAAGESTGLIGRAQEIEALEAQERSAREGLEDLGARIPRVAEGLAEVTARIEEDDAVLAELQNGLAGLRRDRQNAETEALRQAGVAAELAEEETRLQQREADLQETVDRASADLETRDTDRAGLEAESRVADESTREFEIQRRAQQEAVSGRRVEIASLRERVEALRQEAQRQRQSQTDLGLEMERLVEEKAQNDGRRTHLNELVAAASGELEGLHRTQTELEQARDTQVSRQHELMTAARGMEEKLRELNRRVSQNQERLHKLDVELTEMKTRSSELLERMRSEYDADIVELGLLDDPEFTPDITQKKVIEIQERLRRMGGVNLEALEEYEKQKERFDFLVKQRDDLLEAEETLKRTISKIDRAARSRFVNTFSLIRENFQKTFVAFFEGGEADIFMPPEEDPLEAPMHIIARPRGKRLQNINLLSGGERALTAIALLFAIYLVKPSPFCILDEVDAPLDDANVTRFVRVLQEFSRDTQFIVITHNKGTMEAGDSLHGITMEEPGVSKLVSVRLKDMDGGGNGRTHAPAEEVAEPTPADDD